MFIIWRKYGIATPLIMLASVWLTQSLTDAVFGEHYHIQHKFVTSLGFVAGSGVLFGVGYLLDKEHQANDFFFIPMKYWAFIGVAFAIVAPFL